jgi:AcrR family transcriptional regulator
MLDAARNAFEDVGYEAATMRQIADAAGVAVGTLFNYFPDKGTLLREALRSDLEDIIENAPVDAPSKSLPELFAQIARPFYAYYCERPELSRVLLSHSLFAGDDVFREQAERVGRVVVDRVRAMQQSGAVSPDASAEAIVLAFFSHYYLILMTELGGGSDVDGMIDRLRLLAKQLETGVGANR